MATDYISALLGDGESKGGSSDVVGSLFGLPYGMVAQQEAMQRLQGSRNEAMQFAQLDPFQRANYMLYQGGSGLVGGLGGLFGGDSAAVAEAKRKQALMGQIGQIDTSTPTGKQAAIKMAYDANDPETGLRLKQMFIQQGLKEAQTKKYLTEEPTTQAEAMRLAQLQRELGPEAGSATFLQERSDQKRATTNINMPKQDTAYQTGLGGIQAKRLEAAYAKSDAAAESLGNLVKLAELNQQPLIAGSLADQRKETANFLSTIGLASKEDAARLANTQEFEKEAKGLAISWAKKLGFNPSNADVQFIVAALPSLLTDPVARTNIINRMAKVNQDIIDETGRMEAYGAEKGNLNGYKPTIRGYSPTAGFTALKTPLTEMSDSELDALIAKKKGGK